MVHTARREPAPTGFRPLRIDLWVVTHPDSETHSFKKKSERGREGERGGDYVSTVTISESILGPPMFFTHRVTPLQAFRNAGGSGALS